MTRFCCYVILFCLLYSRLLADNCSEVLYHKLKARYLANRVIESQRAYSESECAQSCSQNRDCVSVNFKASGENRGLCELNDGLLSDDDGLGANGYIYMHVVKRTCKRYEIYSAETRKCIPARSCKQLLSANSELNSGVYHLQDENTTSDYPVYCHMTEIPGCVGKGWTLVMKLDGGKDTFKYASSYWSNKNTYQVKEGLEGLTAKEAKLQSYWNTPFTKLCVGMSSFGVTNWLGLEYQASSLHSVIADGKYRRTTAGRNMWKSLINRSSLQYYCNKEGFNLQRWEPLIKNFQVRLGIVANNERDCGSCDSLLGFGVRMKACYGVSTTGITSGNFARCSGDNGSKTTVVFGFILVQ